MSSQPHGLTVGVFGSDAAARSAFEAAVAKKSEAEGIVVHHRTEGSRRLSLLDTADYPDRIQGYARVASMADHAFYIFPRSGRLAAPDGELAVLADAFSLPGTIEIMDGVATAESAAAALKGTAVASYAIDERASSSSVLDASAITPRPDFRSAGTLVYIDRAFPVKGVGTVALGFVLSGAVKVHDQLRPIPGAEGTRADVKGIQINDQDHESAGRGIRVGLSLKGVDAKELEKSHWLDDGTFRLADSLTVRFQKSAYYRGDVKDRDMHLQVPGEMLPARLGAAPDGSLTAALAYPVPAWDGMRVAVADLNAKALRIAGGGACRF